MRTVTTDFERLVRYLTKETSSRPAPFAGDVFGHARNLALAQLGEPRFDPEEWLYTDLGRLIAGLGEVEHQSAPASSSSSATTEAVRSRLACREGEGVPVTLVLNEAEGVERLTPEARSGAMVSRMRSESDEVQATVKAHLGSLSAQCSNPLVAVNSAFLSDGIVVNVPRGIVCDEVIRLVHLVTGDQATFPRTLIVVEEGASVTIVEELVIIGDREVQNPAVAEIVLAPGAHCSYTRLIEATPTTQQLSAVFVRADRDAQFRSFFMNTGGAVVRDEVYPTLVGAGAEVHVSGLALGQEKERVDTVVSMEHAAPHCQSRQLFKGIYAGQSTGAFSGTIVVHEGAQKTNAFQSNKSILLSPDAAVYTKPQLKIWADDVKCSHGATVGQIDEDALFYLRSRGIPAETARILLVHAFVGEVLAEISSSPVRALLSGIVEQRLSLLLR